jgi:hypothetical protein
MKNCPEATIGGRPALVSDTYGVHAGYNHRYAGFTTIYSCLNQRGDLYQVGDITGDGASLMRQAT